MKYLVVALIVIFLNLLFLDWQVLQLINKPSAIKQNATNTSTNIAPNINSSTNTITSTNTNTNTPVTTPKADSICSQSCINIIKQATATAQPIITTQTTTVPSTPSNPQAYFVPFGSGSVASTDWQNVSGLQAYVDTANYSGQTTVTFEASVHVPTGNETANVRLFNVTDGHPVWYSEVFFNGGSNSQLLVSQPITLDKGNKLYQVQMKTQLTFPAILDQARLHILTN